MAQIGALLQDVRDDQGKLYNNVKHLVGLSQANLGHYDGGLVSFASILSQVEDFEQGHQQIVEF